MSSDLQHAFAHHPRKYKENRYVYAVLSRRAGGISVGINLNPDKACNFDCVYCQVDRTAKKKAKPDIDMEYISAELQEIYEDYQSGRLNQHPLFRNIPREYLVLKDISLSGDGEPTMAPEFAEVCGLMREFQKKLNEKVQLQLISNATLFHLKKVREGLRLLTGENGVIWGKLDAGTEDWFQKIERTRYHLDHIVDNLKNTVAEFPLIIQSMWCGIDGLMPDEVQQDNFAEHAEAIYKTAPQNFKEIHLYTLARKPGEAGCVPVEKQFLDTLEQKLSARIPRPVKVFHS